MCKVHILRILVIVLLHSIIGTAIGNNSTLFRFQRETNGCELLQYPDNGSWEVFNTTFSYSAGMIAPTGTILVVNCKSGYELIGSNTILCNYDGWTTSIGRCLKRCKARSSTSFVFVFCSFNSVPLQDCLKPVEGTLARFKCADFYEDESLERHPFHVCTGGQWSYDLPKCEPKCGQKTVSRPTLIVNGENVTRGDYPWQVAVYNATSKVLICGGSLINQRMILTAAHCLTDERGIPFPTDLYNVAVGKYYRKIDDPRDNEAQFSQVNHIFIPKQYKGEIQNYGADIGVIITKKIFKLSFTVQPVCMDWGLKYEDTLIKPSKKLVGYVSGWGYTIEFKKPSEVLKHLKVPPVSKSECEKRIPENYERYLTDDKLCAGYLDSRTSVCRGDSGGGLVFRYNLRYYIMGVVSNSPQAPTTDGGCDSQQYGLYTKVSEYARVFLLDIEAKHKPTSEEIECENNPSTCSFKLSEPTPTDHRVITIPKNNCILPSHPMFGQWNILKNSLSLLPGSPVPSGTLLEITCKDNYQLSGSKIIGCQNGNWSAEISKCLGRCLSLKNTTTSLVECTLNEDTVACQNPLEGTVARYKCADFYENLQQVRNPVRVCLNGEWDQKPPECDPVCGQKSVSTTTLIVGGKVAPKNEYPWQVLIYRTQDKKFYCGGSLINERVILSAAHCVIDGRGKPHPSSYFTVAVGKYYNKYNDSRDNYAQYSSLQEIFVPDSFKGPVASFYGDISVLISKKLFTLSKQVQPICVDWSSQYETIFQNTTDNLLGYIAGWGLEVPGGSVSEVLKHLEVPYIPEESCRKYVPKSFRRFVGPDKICGGYLNQKQSTCSGDAGSGLMFKLNGRYYIAGILSLSPSKDGVCDQNQYSLYTRLSHFVSFVIENEARYRPYKQDIDACENYNCENKDSQQNSTISSNRCILPEHPAHGYWNVFESLPTNLDPGSFVPVETIIEIKCKDGFTLDGESFLVCENSGWSGLVGKCSKSCSSVFTTDSRKVSCSYRGKTLENCISPLEGAIAKFECAYLHEFKTTHSSTGAVCQNGDWSQAFPECTPVCGQKGASTLPLIIGGRQVAHKEFPWQVAIYKKINSETKFICGGTLISSKIILTGAVCVTNYRGEIQPKTEFLAAAGKFYVKHDDPRDSITSQSSKLANIFVPKEYKGLSGDYVADIAVLVTVKNFIFSLAILPACVDWNSDFDSRITLLFKTRKLVGYTCGWGYTKESGAISNELRTVAIPGLSNEQCLRELPPDFQRFLSFDKICAGYKNGSAVCNGDSGGGLVFKQEGKYFLTGIISLSPAKDANVCDSHQYTLFTKVSAHIDFVKKFF